MHETTVLALELTFKNILDLFQWLIIKLNIFKDKFEKFECWKISHKNKSVKEIF